MLSEGRTNFLFSARAMLFICLVLLSSLLANGQDISFNHIGIKEGLSQNAVLSLEKDYRGFMWFGTRDGLNRFDGYSFRIYKHNPADSTSLINNEVTVLYEDKANNLWIGAGGIHRYNRSTDRLERVVTVEDISPDLPRIFISDIEADHQGNLWFSVIDKGIYQIHLITDGNGGNNYQLIGPYSLSDSKSNPEFKISDLQRVDQEMWISNRRGLFRLKASEGGSFPQPTQTQFAKVSLPLGEKNLRFSSLFLDEQDIFWATCDEGLIRIDRHDALSRSVLFNYPDDYSRVDCLYCGKKIAQDELGQIWMTSFEGLISFNPSDKTYRLFTNDPDNPASLSLNNTTDILIEDDILWVGTMGMGVNLYDAAHVNFQHYLDREKSGRLFSLYNLLVDKQQRVWFIDSYKKLGYLDTDADTFGIFEPFPDSDWALADMKKDDANNFWMVSKGTLIFFDPLNKDFETYTIPGIDHPYTWSYEYKLFVESENKIWICNTEHLFLFNRQTRRFKDFGIPLLESEHVNCIYQDNNKEFWIGTVQRLLHFDPASGEYRSFGRFTPQKDSLNFPLVKHILPDPMEPDRFLWLSTGGGGIYRFDKDSLTFKAYTTEDGLPNNFVYGTLADDIGKLWISTNKGLSRFDPDRETFYNFTNKDGLQSEEFNSDAFYKDDQGTLYFGGINGLTVFQPNDSSLPQDSPPVVITELQMMYEQIGPLHENSPLKTAITETKILQVKHDQNNLAFTYAALEYSYPEKIKYRYQLEGFDRDWVLARNERTANYTNLSPGNYTFRVGVSKNGKDWSTKEASLDLSVAPPLWRTWWAYIFYFISFTVLVLVAYRLQVERVRMNEEIKRKAFENERLAELEQFKSDFFANVSHELRTPLTIIVSKLEEGRELRQEDRNLLEVLKVAMDNTHKVSKLIDQLLDISRLENDRMEIKLIEEDLVYYINLVCASLQPIAEKKSLTLTFSTPLSSVFVYLDPEVIQKILQNLIVNSIKNTPGGGRIVVTLETNPDATPPKPDQEWATISVSDDGVGISEEQLPYIFDRFYQSNLKENYKPEGFGLGLSLVKELVKILDGNIDVESTPGQGTTFNIHLPFTKVKQSAAKPQRDISIEKVREVTPERASSLVSGDQTKNKDDRPTLLVVEDHEELRKLLYQQLTNEYRVMLAANGEEGEKIAKKTVPDLIVTDLMMPDKDGLEMSRNLKTDETTSHIPIIILTARTDQAIKLRGYEAGIDDFLTKPFSRQELVSRIANLIETRNKLRQRYARVFSGQLSENREFTLEETFLFKLTELVKQNIADEHFGVDALASEVSMSASQLYRKVKALTGLSTLQFMQHYRLQQAKKLLEKGYNVSETTFMVGFTNPSYFSQLFKKHTGKTPLAYAKKFRSENESAD